MAADGRETETYTVRVPKQLAEEVDDVWAQRGFASRSEFIRDALRTAVHPPVTISEEFLEHVAASRAQRARGEYATLDDVE